jgi:hypothetical protein
VKLKATEKRAILRGEHPRLERPYEDDEKPPFTPGDEIPLKELSSLAGPVSQVSIVILRCRRSKKGDWVASYSVKDDRALYVARQPGYTRLAEQSLDAEAPVLDEETEKRWETEQKLTRIQRAADREDAKEVRKKRQRQIRERLGKALDGLPPEGQIALLASVERLCKEAAPDATMKAA